MVVLELRASGGSYMQIGWALPVSKARAFRIVREALDELLEGYRETAQRFRQLELHRLDRYRLALDSRRSDPRTVDTLIRISVQVAKLQGLEPPQRTETSGPEGASVQAQEQGPNYSKLELDELLLFEALDKKDRGIVNWDEHLRKEEDFRCKCSPGIQQPEIWTERLAKLGILPGAHETVPDQS